MKEITMISEGAFFVSSFSEQTVVGFQNGITNQTVISSDIREIEEDQSQLITEETPVVNGG